MKPTADNLAEAINLLRKASAHYARAYFNDWPYTLQAKAKDELHRAAQAYYLAEHAYINSTMGNPSDTPTDT